MAGQASAERAPSLADYLTSVHELQILVTYSNYRPDISADVLTAILKSHISHLSSPSSPFGSPNPASRSAIEKGKAVFPGTKNVQLELFDGEAGTSLLISDKLDIDEVEALVLFRRFRRDEAALIDAEALDNAASQSTSTRTRSGKSKNLSNDLLDQITKYYLQESLAVSKLLTTLIRESHADEDTDMADFLGETPGGGRSMHLPILDVLDKVIGSRDNGDERKAFVYKLFSEFGKVMQTEVPATSKEMQRLWTLHYLRLQTSLLESLLLYNYYALAQITANLTRGLINGALSCAFGADQVNRRQIERLPGDEGFRLVGQIQQLLGLICVDSLRFTDVAQGAVSLDETTVANIPEQERYLVQSPEHIMSLHDSLNKASCVATEPFPLLLLAWAWVLSRLPKWLLPTVLVSGGAKSYSEDSECLPHQRVAEVALSPQLRLFQNWQSILTGNLLWQEGEGSHTVEDALVYKDISRSLLTALMECVRPEYIPDYDGLVGVWCSLYGEGDTQTVAGICAQALKRPDDLGFTDILSTTRFPYDSLPLLRILKSMTGSGSQRDGNDIDPDAEASAESVYELFNNLSSVTFEYTEDPRMMSIFERERTDTGHVYLINRVPVQLPGGSVIPKGTRGRVISRPRVIPEVVKWVTPISGFGLLLETMKLAVGLVGEADSAAVGNAEEDVFGTTQSSIESFSLRDIGITQAMVQDGILLSDGLAYLEALLRASSDTSDLAAAIAVLGQTPEQASALIPTLLAVIKQRPSRIATMDDSRIQTLARATRILARLLRCIPGPICDFLRRPAFFHDQAAYPSIAKAGIHLEIRRGTYSWTTSILQLVHALAVEVLSKQLVTAPDLLHVQVNTLRSALVFTHTIIWSEFDTWRYARIGDKATIGELLCEIYRTVLSDPLVFASLQKPSPMRPISAFIVETFITSPAPFSIGPLVNALRTPYKLVPALHRRNRRADSAKVEKHLDQALQLAETLLRQSQLLPAPRPAALEGSFTRTDLLSENETRTLVDTIFGYAVSTDIFDRTISISSLRLLRTLARGLAQLGSNASPMLVCLQDATATAADLMAVLANPERDMDLTYEVWALLNAAATTQPGLLRLCVTGEGEGTALIDANASDRTAMAIALGIIERYGKTTDGDALWETRPRLLSLATSFLKNVWENLPDLILADRVKNNSELWTAIEQLVLQNQISPNILDLNHWERDTSDDTIAYCYRRVARANAVDLMQLSLKSSQTTRGERDVGLTRTSTLLADKEQVAGAVAEAGQNACRPEVHQRVHDLFAALYPECAVEDLRSGKDEQDRVYGDQYLFNVESIASLLGGAVDEKHQAIISGLSDVNIDWSVSDADAQLTSAWYRLLQAALEVVVPYPRISSTASTTAAAFASHLQEPQAGVIYQKIQMERFLIMQVLAELSWIGDDPVALGDVLVITIALDQVLVDPQWAPTLLLRQNPASRMHHTIYRSVFYFLGKLASSSMYSPRVQQVLRPFLTTVIRSSTESLGIVLRLANSSGQEALQEDVGVLCSILSLVMEPDFRNSSSAWLPLLEDNGILRQSLTLIGETRLEDAPLYARHLLALHGSLARHQASAERLVELGILNIYLESPLFIRASRVGLAPSMDDDLANSLYQLWTDALEVITTLLATLSDVTNIRSADVRVLLEAISSQARVSLHWDIDHELALFRIPELHCVVDLFYHYACKGDWLEAEREAVFEYFAPMALHLLMKISYTLSHPSTLERLVRDIEEYPLVTMQAEGAAAAFPRNVDLHVMAQTAAITSTLIAIGQTVVLTLLRWSGSVSLVQRNRNARMMAPALALPTLDDNNNRNAIHDLLEFANTVNDQVKPSCPDHILTERRKRARIPQWREILPDLQLPDLPDIEWDGLLPQTTEMTAVLATAQTLLSKEQAMDAAAAEQTEVQEKGTPDKGNIETKDAQRRRSAEGTSKQNLRDLYEFLQRMSQSAPNGYSQTYVRLLSLLRSRIKGLDDL